MESVAFTKNTLVGQTQKFIHKIFSSLLDLAHKVSFHCEGLKSHLYNLKPSQLPPWCYIICVLHGNDTLVFYWFSGHFENVEYGYYYYYYCTTMDWRSSLTLELTLLLLISLSLSFISETSCFSLWISFSCSSFCLWYLTSSINYALFFLLVCFRLDVLLGIVACDFQLAGRRFNGNDEYNLFHYIVLVVPWVLLFESILSSSIWKYFVI